MVRHDQAVGCEMSECLVVVSCNMRYLRSFVRHTKSPVSVSSAEHTLEKLPEPRYFFNR